MVWFHSWVWISFSKKHIQQQWASKDENRRYWRILWNFWQAPRSFPIAETALEDGDISVEFRYFMQEDLDNVYSILREMKDDIDNIVVAKKSFRKTKADFADIILSFIYTLLIKFVETNKVKGILMSKNFIDNLKGIMENKIHIHHSHISGEIIEYAHRFCHYKVTENK